jgi:hypothetical protein
VSRLTKLAALLLLALWLPATLHCGLESAGLISSASICTDGSNDHCAGDNCTQVENGLFNQKTGEIQVMSPDLFACACFLCPPLQPSAPADESDFQPSAQPQDWVTTWHFVRRNAPAPRAPSAFLA